jgi:hypothetical protein
MYLKELGWEAVDWIYVARDRDKRRAVLYTEMNYRVP